MTNKYLYAQEHAGQRLHLVEYLGNNRVCVTALCGRQPLKRGAWRMTINVPLASACRRCLKMLGRLEKR